MLFLSLILNLHFAENVELELWDEERKCKRFPMNKKVHGWVAELNLFEGMYHYCFLINNGIRVVDPETYPVYMSPQGRMVSSLMVEEDTWYKISSLSSEIEMVQIEMHTGEALVGKNIREFSHLDQQVGLTLTFGKVKGFHQVVFLWVNPLSQIVFGSDCTVWDDPQCKGISLQASAWLNMEPDRPLLPGNWQVIVMLNGEFKEVVPFTIRNCYYGWKGGKVVTL